MIFSDTKCEWPQKWIQFISICIDIKNLPVFSSCIYYYCQEGLFCNRCKIYLPRQMTMSSLTVEKINCGARIRLRFFFSVTIYKRLMIFHKIKWKKSISFFDGLKIMITKKVPNFWTLSARHFSTRTIPNSRGRGR